MNSQPSSPSILRMVGTAVIFLGPLVYFIIAINTDDLLWFSPIFSYQPQTVLIHCFGNDISIESNTSEFETVTNLVNDSLSGRKRWDSLTISDATYQDYQSHPDMMVVELSYSEPVRIHSRYKYYSNVEQIIIPLVGRHAQSNAVFGRNNDRPLAGSFHVTTTTPIRNYLTESGLCIEP